MSDRISIPAVFKSPLPKIPVPLPQSTVPTSSPQQLLAQFNLIKSRLRSRPATERGASSPNSASSKRSISADATNNSNLSPSGQSIFTPTSTLVSPSLSGSQIAALAQAAAATPYKPFQTMTEPNFIQLLIAFSKAAPESRAGYLDDSNASGDESTEESNPINIDRRVQKRLIQWGLAQRNLLTSAAMRNGGLNGRDRFQVPAAKSRSQRARVPVVNFSPQPNRTAKYTSSPNSGNGISSLYSGSPSSIASLSSPKRTRRRDDESKSPSTPITGLSINLNSPLSSARSPNQPAGSPNESIFSPSGNRKRSKRVDESSSVDVGPVSGRSSPLEGFLSPRRSPRLSPASKSRMIEK